MSKDIFWLYNIESLFSYNNIADFPSFDNTTENNMNCMTRILVFISLLLMCMNFKFGTIFLFISLIIICHLIKEMSKENFELSPKKTVCDSNTGKQAWESGTWSVGASDGTPLTPEQIKDLQESGQWSLTPDQLPKTQGELNELRNSYSWHIERPDVFPPRRRDRDYKRVTMKGSYAENPWMNNTNQMQSDQVEGYSLYGNQPHSNFTSTCDKTSQEVNVDGGSVDGQPVTMTNFDRFMNNTKIKRKYGCDPVEPKKTTINVLS